MRPDRPFLVGLVCWALILLGCYYGYRDLRQLGSDDFAAAFSFYPYPAIVAEIILWVTLVVMIVCGILMYEGQGWARYIYLAGVIPCLVQNFLAISQATNPATAEKIWGIEVLLYLVSAVFLFLPTPRRFFNPPMYVDE